VLTDPNALITDPEEMEKYQPQGPQPPTNSLHGIKSGMNRGPAFAAADAAASEKLYKYCVSAQEGIQGYINEAKQSKRVYLDADATTTAGVQGIIEPILCVDDKSGLPTPVEPSTKGPLFAPQVRTPLFDSPLGGE
jgi:hypothetical protein